MNDPLAEKLRERDRQYGLMKAFAAEHKIELSSIANGRRPFSILLDVAFAAMDEIERLKARK